jgi:hypothetical protein
MPIRLLLLALVAALIAMPAAAQSAPIPMAGRVRMDAVPGALPPRLVPSAPASSAVAVDGIAGPGRPWYLLPAIGAGIGLLVGLLVDDDCGQKDATVCFPPPLLGVGYGTALGVVAEIML